ncbi:hypothetical protein M9434_005683 [Picochlorum sp. BPE23]|nr:hypothetical protein M9434_005683 [Picochlorum sp. BPE23]
MEHDTNIDKKLEMNASKLQRYIDKAKKRGIIYLSRLPPNMKPQKIRHLLEQYGEIGRVYLAAEDPSVRKKRKKMGGHSGKKFTEGWVEFEDKKDAKLVAKLLNGEPMGGKKRSAHYYDLWCIKYLPKFSWDHLTEELNYQRAVKDQKMAAEVAAAKRERDFYLSRVDKAKAVEAIIERQQQDDGDATQLLNTTTNTNEGEKKKPNKKGPRKVRTFDQNKTIGSGAELKGTRGTGLRSDVLKKLAGIQSSHGTE